MTPFNFLPNIPVDHVLERLNRAGGNEIESGKLISPQSSAALAIDAFGPFIKTPNALPEFPGLELQDWSPSRVDIEYQARFPWSGGRHPWLDAVVQTETTLIGVESKRFEPYRDRKTAGFSGAYDRDVWGDNMQPFEMMRDALNSGKLTYHYLDAVQLVKHAFGLRTEGIQRKKGRPILAYVYIETPHTTPFAFNRNSVDLHKAEIIDFAARVKNAEVDFVAFSYEHWLGKFPSTWTPHAKAVAQKYRLNID